MVRSRRRSDTLPLTARAVGDRDHDIDRIVETFELFSLAISDGDADVVRAALELAWKAGRDYQLRHLDEGHELGEVFVAAGNGGAS